MNTEDLTVEELEERIAPGVLANDAALPANNPGTANAAGFPPPLGDGAIPSNVFSDHVQDQWLGKAAGR